MHRADPGGRVAALASDILDESRALREAFTRFQRYTDYLHAAHHAALQARVDALLATIRVSAAGTPAAARRDARLQDTVSHETWLHDTLRCVHWNILHGSRFDRVLDALQHEPRLASADLIVLNEVDLGLARSGNRDVCGDLARQMGMHAAWAPLFLELAGGFRSPPDVAAMPQRESLFGLGLLSRHPLGQVRRLPLDSPDAILFDRERKLGSFIALVVEVLPPGGRFHVVVTHLDVHRGPADRRRQVEAIVSALPPGPVILAGDLNTTTFGRGGWPRAVHAFGVLAATPPAALQRRLLRPHERRGRGREPLFDVLRRAGFEIDALNDATPSLDMRLEDLSEVDALPPLVRRLAWPLLRHVERRGRHRLDWIVARGLGAAPDAPPFALPHLMRGDAFASDHAPIGCGLRPAGG